ncbi:MAG TPA: glycosyltransferase family 9 protein [Chthonomonadaceae bacterium]|nr:glycosyltransferase family 9 protein [Chthonomonadaceae bacterium]
MTLPAVDMASVRRILIIKLSALGDIIHALPITAALGEAFPDVELTWVVEEAFAPLLTGNPYLSRILTLPKVHTRRLRSAKFRRTYFGGIRSLREDRYDLALDLQGLTKSALLAVASRAPVRLGYHFQREAAPWLVRPVPPRPQSAHVVEHYLDVARHLGAEPDRVRFPFAIPEDAEENVVAMLCEAGIDPHAPFVTVNPAAGTALKQWGAANYAALMDAIQEDLRLPAVLVTADLAVAAQVRRAARYPFGDLAGRTDLKQLAAVLRRGAVHVCGDTGSGHLAAALECPVISLIGPSEPERVCPYGQRANTIQYRALCGGACRHHHCQYDRPKCLEAIMVSEVLNRIRTFTPSRVAGRE